MSQQTFRDVFPFSRPPARLHASPVVAETRPAVGALSQKEKRAKWRQQNKRFHLASLVTLVCGYVTLAAIVLWLAFALWQRAARRNETTLHALMERTCVDLTRHAVRPMTPAVDSAPGGVHEPFAFGTLRFDLSNEELSWALDDSLGIEPHELDIRGPLADGAHTAPVFVRLGVQRNARHQLAGATRISAELIRHIRAEPQRYYIAVHEQLVGGRVRELARSALDKKCKIGVE